MATPPPPPNTPTTPLGTTFTSDGLRRSHRIARLTLKNISEGELDFNLRNLQGSYGFPDTTMQNVKQTVLQLYASSPPALMRIGSATFGFLTRIANAMAQFNQSYAVLGAFRDQLLRILPKMAEALTIRIVHMIVGWSEGDIRAMGEDVDACQKLGYMRAASTSSMQSNGMESTPLLGHKDQLSRRNVRRYLTDTVNVHYAPLPLLVCCFLVGLIDAASYNAWSVFMRNTIFLALSTASLPAGSDSFKWARSGVSILSMMVGSFIAGQVYPAVGLTRRSTLVASFLLQALCIAIAAILVQTDAVPETNATEKIVLVAIPFLAAQSGAQVATAKGLGFSELPTTVLTSTYNDLATDTNLLAWNNPKRDRRVGSVVIMILGGIGGAWLVKDTGTIVTVLWLGAAVKVLLAFSWLLFPAESQT
ncbi:MAG: hypothetical protein Q9221_003300 [Calogaya cf. arnoldii]